MPEPYYCTKDEVRTELAVDSSVLSDAAALKLILQTEDLVDDLLGGWPPDITTGRKILQANVDAWQWAKLNRATYLLAADVYANPARYTGQAFRSVSGPDFSFSGPLQGQVPRPILAVLDASGLRRLVGRTTPSRTRNRITADRFLSARRHNGT
jgi:hypothetical protein